MISRVLFRRSLRRKKETGPVAQGGGKHLKEVALACVDEED